MPAKRPTLDVACIIPYYNGSDTIERAISSIVTQKAPCKEIIVVNDGSRDEELAFLNDLATRYDFIILNKPNGGQGSARNAGARFTTSRYITFLDQDDFYLPWHLETLYLAFDHDNALFGFSYGDATEGDYGGNILRRRMIKSHAIHPKEDIIQYISADAFILPSAVMLSRNAFLDVGGFDEQFTGYEDDDLFMRMFRAGYYCNFVDKPVYVWCIHSASTSYSMKMARSRFRYIKKLCVLFPDDPWSAKFYIRDCIYPRFVNMLMFDYIKARVLKSPNEEEYRQLFEAFILLTTSHLDPKVDERLRHRYLMIKYTPRKLLAAAVFHKTGVKFDVRSLVKS